MTDSFGKESGGNSQSDQRPSGWLNAPSGRRSKYAVLKSVPSQVNSHDSASDCVVSAIAPRCPEHCLRSFRVHPLDPELDLAVLPGDVADPRVEGPTLRRARLRFRRLQGPSSQPYHLNLRVSPVTHGASLPEASAEDPRLWPSVWAARSVPASAADAAAAPSHVDHPRRGRLQSVWRGPGVPLADRALAGLPVRS